MQPSSIMQDDATAPPLVVESYTPLENQPAEAGSQAGTSRCWLVLRNQPTRLGLRNQPRRPGLTADPASMARSWDPAMQASSPPRTSLHRRFLRTSPAGWVSPQTQPRWPGPENQPAGRLNATPPPWLPPQPAASRQSPWRVYSLPRHDKDHHTQHIKLWSRADGHAGTYEVGQRR